MCTDEFSEGIGEDKMGEGADMLCTVPTSSLDVNEQEIFRSLFQSLSEKTERISLISLIFGQDPNLSDTQAKGYLRVFFARPSEVRKISNHIHKLLPWVNRKG